MKKIVKVRPGYYIFPGQVGIYSIKKSGRKWIVSDKRAGGKNLVIFEFIDWKMAVIPLLVKRRTNEENNQRCDI